MTVHKPYLFLLVILTIVLQAGYSTGTTEEEPLTIETTEALLDNSMEIQGNTIKLRIGEEILTATLVENSSTKALRELLLSGPLTIDMRDYGNMEKVGSLGTDLPRNDQQITTAPGDLILFQGSALVIYYESNSWNFTKLGTINNVTQEELKEVLGSGNVAVTLSLD